MRRGLCMGGKVEQRPPPGVVPGAGPGMDHVAVRVRTPWAATAARDFVQGLRESGHGQGKEDRHPGTGRVSRVGHPGTWRTLYNRCSTSARKNSRQRASLVHCSVCRTATLVPGAAQGATLVGLGILRSMADHRRSAASPDPASRHWIRRMPASRRDVPGASTGARGA